MPTNRINGSIYTKIDKGVATLEFGHKASNAFVTEMLDRFTEALIALSENEAVTLLVVKSEGDRAFCAGASLEELMAVSSLEEGTTFFNGFAKVINAMRSCPKIIIGRVQGKAVGGGVGLIAACDYVFASVDAAIRLSELTIGIAPLVIAPAVGRKIGPAAMAELALAPTEWKNAYWAQQKGLFSKVFDTMSVLDTELDFFTQKLASYNPQALRKLKMALWEGTADWETLLYERAAMTGTLALSEFTKHALSKFKK